MAYSERITIYVPEALAPVARAVARALDPDFGGAFSFTWIYGGEAVYSTPCVPEFADGMEYFQALPELFYNSVVRDYSARWPDLTPPTLEQIAEFCRTVRLVRGLWEAPPEINGGDNVWI